MKRQTKTRIQYFLMRVLLLGGLLSGERGRCGLGIFARRNKSGISSFCYRYDGTIGGNNYTYRVFKKDGKVVFSYETMRRRESGATEKPADQSLLDRLEEIYKNLRLAGWNGYSKHNKLIRDGRGFSLSIDFNNDKSLYARGMNAFPPRYGEFCDEMEAAFTQYIDKK
ncbi:MAG: hypothetical protein J5852_03880 [Clostridia bacterium]|nr:hypothetical protein [Clostridia bacterium]